MTPTLLQEWDMSWLIMNGERSLPRKSMSNPMISIIKEIKELKDPFKAIEGLVDLQESTTRLLQLSEETRTDTGKVCLSLDGLKEKGTKLFNRIFAKMDTIKAETISSNNVLIIFVKNSYSSFTKSLDKSYDHFYHNMQNTLTYLLAK